MAICQTLRLQIQWSPRNQPYSSLFVDLWTPTHPQRGHCHSSLKVCPTGLDVVYTPVPADRQQWCSCPSSSVGRSVAGLKVVHLFTVTFGMSSKIVWYLSHRAVDKCDVLCSCKIMETASTICVKRPFNLVTWPQPFPCCQGSQGLFKMCIIWNKRSTICTHSQEW